MSEDRSFRPRLLERVLALVGAIACVAFCILIWRAVSGQQEMWPLPALYLIEVSALSILAMLVALRGASVAGAVVWAAVGIFLAFVILGALSIGLAFAPIALLFTATGILIDARHRRNILIDLAIALVAGAAQAAVMLTVIRFL